MRTFHSIKVYNSQFRKWGIRKNLKRREAMELAEGQDTSTIFWPDNRDEEYAARIDRHLRNSKYRPDSASSRAQTVVVADSVTPPRRFRGPDTLEKVEAAGYYFQIYITSNHEPETWLKHCPCFGEQGNFSSLFIRGLERLSRNDQPHQAFKDINLAFDQLKQVVEWNHPMVYMRLMDAIAAFSLYPKSEICSTICRLLSDHVRKLSFIVHGPNHPLNYAWGEALHVSSAEGPESFVIGVAKSMFRKCMARRGREAMGTFDISKCVPSDARDLDEASLRGSLMEMGTNPDLLAKAQETRLALAELLISENRLAEGCHFYRLAMAFQDDDPVRRASKTFWTAELQWRSGITWGSLDTLKSALAYAEIESMDEKDNGDADDLRKEIKCVLSLRQNLLVTRESSKHVEAGHKCPATNLENTEGSNVRAECLQAKGADCPLINSIIER